MTNMGTQDHFVSPITPAEVVSFFFSPKTGTYLSIETIEFGDHDPQSHRPSTLCVSWHKEQEISSNFLTLLHSYCVAWGT